MRNDAFKKMSNFDNSNSNGGGGGGTISSKTLVENSALREAENEDIRNQIAKVYIILIFPALDFERINSGNFKHPSVVLLPYFYISIS